LIYFIQHCFICRLSDSAMSKDAGIEPRTVCDFSIGSQTSPLRDYSIQEYQSVCPFVGIGSPTSYPASECGSPPQDPGEEGTRSLAWGIQFGRLNRKPGTLYTLCSNHSAISHPQNYISAPAALGYRTQLEKYQTWIYNTVHYHMVCSTQTPERV
jgi:hypothetical protein